MGWQRWFNYYRAKVNGLVKRADADLDRREAELEVEKAEKPWLHTDRDTPTFDEAKARIEDLTKDVKGTGVPPTPAPPPGDPEAAKRIAEFDLAKQQAAAEERLASIRESLDIKDPPPK